MTGPAQGDEKLVQLLERLAKPTCTPGGDGSVEGLLGGIEFVQDQQRLVAFVFESHRSHGTIIAFLICPDQPRGRRHFDVSAEESDRLL